MARDPPALLTPGTRVRLVPRVSVLEVVERAGPLTTVQDLGRPGYAHLGVPRSGALDPPALRLANRLVGNPEDAAGLEITLGRLRARLDRAGTVALTGAGAPLRVDGRPAPLERAGIRAGPGACIEVGAAVAGLRPYLAVAGGIAVPPVLGSRSTDTLSGLGPPSLRDGVTLPLGTPTAPSTVDVPRWPGRPASCGSGYGSARAHDWFTDGRSTCCSAPRTRSAVTATGSAPGWSARPCPARWPANCPARASCSARCRCRRTGSR